MILHGGAKSSPRPDTVWDNRCDYEAHEGRMQTDHRTAHAGSRLRSLMSREGTAWKPAFQPYWGKPAVRNDRGIDETSASFEARSAPRSYPTELMRELPFALQPRVMA